MLQLSGASCRPVQTYLSIQYHLKDGPALYVTVSGSLSHPKRQTQVSWRFACCETLMRLAVGRRENGEVHARGNEAN